MTVFSEHTDPDESLFSESFDLVERVGDGDGDGFGDLAVSVINYGQTNRDSFSETGAVYIFPSRLLREASSQNGTLDLGVMFGIEEARGCALPYVCA